MPSGTKPAAKGKSISAPEVVLVITACVVLLVVFVNMPPDPAYPALAEFKKPEFNPFINNPHYRPPSCEETGYPWNGQLYRKCAEDAPTLPQQYPTMALTCTSERVPDAEFFKPLKESNRIQWLNFTGPVTGQPVSAIVVLPEQRVMTNRMPVIYALHARDQSYEKMSAENKHITFPIEKLHLGFKGWVQDTMCELNDARMEPHILVFPLRGGDRMWIDCDDPSACALETQITKEIIPYVDKHFNTLATASGRSCIGYSMGASGCLNLVVKHPTIFSSIVVQSPGVWPRFVTWDELTATEGQQESDFSTRSFLLDKVFDGKQDYESKNTCNLLENKLHSSQELQNNRPKVRVWFGARDPYIAQDEALFGCFACDQMCQKFRIVKECTHSDFFRCLATESSRYEEYLTDLFNIFKR